MKRKMHGNFPYVGINSKYKEPNNGENLKTKFRRKSVTRHKYFGTTTKTGAMGIFVVYLPSM